MLARQNPSLWSLEHAAHLLNRAGFGGTPEEIRALHGLGLVRAVDRLIIGEEDDDLFPPPILTQPAEHFGIHQKMRSVGDEGARKMMQAELRQQGRREMLALRAWWLERMRHTPHPLREKLTLFWHGHFATSMEKVRVPYLMWQQNETLRAGALGSFAALAKEISKDPAMMRYLDVVRSTRGKPNENFARELMELFTLGEGVCYTEADIRESARAFTGYRIDPETMLFALRRRQFDDGEKTFLGRTGPFTGDDVIRIILEQPECAEFIAAKIWTFFVRENPSPALVQNLAASFRGADFNVASLMREIFLSAEFYAPQSLRSQVKSPVQWMVQTARVLDAPLPSAAAMEGTLAQLGQTLFAPPNVKGWDVGRAWISSSTLLLRYNFAGYIVSGRAPAFDTGRGRAGAVEIPLEAIAPQELRNNPDALRDAIVFRLINGRLEPTENQRLAAFLRARGPAISDEAVRDFLHLVMSTPEFQLT